MSEWQPIESAPKDGTWVLLSGGVPGWWDEYDPPSMVNLSAVSAFWTGAENGGWQSDPRLAHKLDYYGEEVDGYWVMGFWDGAWRTHYYGPTHWMPLPEPPK